MTTELHQLKTDQEILDGIAQGDLEDFPKLYDRYAPRGLRFAYSMIGNVSDAEEAVQEAFCRLLRPIQRGQADCRTTGFAPLFFKTLRNLSIDVLRMKNRRRVVSMNDIPEPIERLAGGDFEKLEMHIGSLMDALPAEWADALRLKIDGGLSYDEIARSMDCTRAQVRTWIYRARRKLEEELRQSDLAPGSGFAQGPGFAQGVEQK